MTSLVLRGSAAHAWSKLVSGDFGLPVTFWVFYFGIPLAWDVGLEAASSSGLIQSFRVMALLQITLLIYVIPVTVGVFRAANRYKGRQPLWAVYAKVFSVLGIGMLVLVIVLLVGKI